MLLLGFHTKCCLYRWNGHHPEKEIFAIPKSYLRHLAKIEKFIARDDFVGLGRGDAEFTNPRLKIDRIRKPQKSRNLPNRAFLL